jgi:antitoxin component YwqK of YwqJK toxin-antitoxin module
MQIYFAVIQGFIIFSFSHRNQVTLFMKKFILFFYIITAHQALYSQTFTITSADEAPTSLNEVVKQLQNDTLLFYYNDRWQLVKPACSTVFRVTRVDTISQTFTGKFTDHYTDSTIAAEGFYLSGKKEGNFSVYFDNGQLEQTGMYADNHKEGIWKYYYKNGSPKQILNFQNEEISILEFWDEEGKKMVDAGTGYWFGYETAERFRKIEGEVLNGKKNGTWQITIPSQKITTNIEKYKNGKFLHGKHISVVNGQESYSKNITFCNVETTPALLTAETFAIGSCMQEPTSTWKVATYPGGRDGFFRDLGRRFVVIESVVKGTIIIEFVIDEKGKMKNFVTHSFTGLEQKLITALQQIKDWVPAEKNGQPVPEKKTINFEIR